MAVTATFILGKLNVFGDNLDNTITESRDAAGNILINGGAVAITGGKPTVANTSHEPRSSARAATTPSPSTKRTAPFPPRKSLAARATT